MGTQRGALPGAAGTGGDRKGGNTLIELANLARPDLATLQHVLRGTAHADKLDTIIPGGGTENEDTTGERWRGVRLDQPSLAALCESALRGNTEKAALVVDLFEARVLELWGSAGNTELPRWHAEWAEEAEALPGIWMRVGASLNVAKPTPRNTAFLPALLLLVISADFRTRLEHSVESVAQQTRSCSWFTALARVGSPAALLVAHSFKDEAVQSDRVEVEAAAQLEREIAKLENEHPHLLAQGSPLAIEVGRIRRARREHKAAEALKMLPALRQRIFDATRESALAQSLGRINARLPLEMLADGLLLACLFVLARAAFGLVVADDAWGFVATRLAALLHGTIIARGYLFALLAIAALAWLAMLVSTRRIAARLFEQPPEPQQGDTR